MSLLPEQDRDYLTNRAISFLEVAENNNRGVIFINRFLPLGRYSDPMVDVFLPLPSGYPDVPPDMFYVFPWVKLTPENKYPKAADQPFPLNGKSWQRWSRHPEANTWRRGIDGIWTAIKRIEHAFEVATI